MGCLELVGGFAWLREREREGRMRRGAWERDILREMALWAMVYFVCSGGWRGVGGGL